MSPVLVRAGAALLAFLMLSLWPNDAEAGSPRKEFWEGQREIARERREMRRDILNSSSREEARDAYREGMREIARERREMRREVRQAVNRRFIGQVIAGVTLGALLRPQVSGRPPMRPHPDLCWYWSDRDRETGFWDYCR